MSPSPLKMTSGSDLLNQCLEFSQTLDKKRRAFSFKVTVGNFSFSLDSSETSPKVMEKKKKLSPSQIRRNQKRREHFLLMKAAAPSDNPLPAPEKEQEKGEIHKCEICDKVFKTEKGLKSHKTRTHKVETLRGLSLDKSLEVSLPSEERENENTSTPVKTKTSELEKSETFGDQLMESLIPCDSCVALFENEEDMKDHLTWCRDTWVPYLKNRSLPGASLDLSTH